MGAWKIGILVDNLELGVAAGLEQAAALGAEGVQIYCTAGEMAPGRMDAAARRALRAKLDSLGLALSALCGDTFKGFFDPTTIEEQISDAKAFIDLAADLGTNVVTTHFGRFPSDPHAPAWRMAYNALSEIGEHGKRRGVYYASETGLESPVDLKAFLDKVGSPYVKVNYDPANLHANGFDFLGGVRLLADEIVHTHAKDFKRGSGEVPLGQGGVDFPRYLAALDAIGYDGFVTIEREGGDDRVGDVKAAVAFLRRLRGAG